jgi:hypothetical protein
MYFSAFCCTQIKFRRNTEDFRRTLYKIRNNNGEINFILRATAQVSPGISNLSGKFRNIDILDAASASPENALAAYTAKFGTLVAGRKIAIELVPVNKTTGQKGQAVSATLVVGA